MLVWVPRRLLKYMFVVMNKNGGILIFGTLHTAQQPGRLLQQLDIASIGFDPPSPHPSSFTSIFRAVIKAYTLIVAHLFVIKEEDVSEIMHS